MSEGEREREREREKEGGKEREREGALRCAGIERQLCFLMRVVCYGGLLHPPHCCNYKLTHSFDQSAYTPPTVSKPEPTCAHTCMPKCVCLCVCVCVSMCVCPCVCVRVCVWCSCVCLCTPLPICQAVVSHAPSSE